MKYCPSCSFDLSSVLVKSKIETPKKQSKKQPEPEPEPESPQETEQDDLIMKVAKNLVVKKDGTVKKKATEKQSSHLQKARDTLEKKRAEKKQQQPKQEPKQEEEQQPAGYVPLFNIFG